jgi:hypothetical protein
MVANTTTETATTFTRLSVPVAEKILEDTGFALTDDLYFNRQDRCACAIGVYAIGKLGLDETEKINAPGGGLDPEDLQEREIDTQQVFGVSLPYLVGLEVGFERWEPELFHRDHPGEDFWQGVTDGEDLRHAAHEGHLPHRKLDTEVE